MSSNISLKKEISPTSIFFKKTAVARLNMLQTTIVKIRNYKISSRECYDEVRTILTGHTGLSVSSMAAFIPVISGFFLVVVFVQGLSYYKRFPDCWLTMEMDAGRSLVSLRCNIMYLSRGGIVQGVELLQEKLRFLYNQYLM